MFEMKLIVNIGLKTVFGSFISVILAAMLHWSPPEPHMNTGFLFANLSGHFVAQLIYPHNILWAIIFSVILPHILASIMTSNDEERSNLFQYSGYCLIGVLLGYSAANFVALVKIMWTGYNQFYRNSPNQQSRDQMFTHDAARDDL